MAALCNLDFLTALSLMLLLTHFWSLDVFSRSWNLMGIIYLPYFISLCPKTNSLMLFYNSINFQKLSCNNTQQMYHSESWNVRPISRSPKHRSNLVLLVTKPFKDFLLCLACQKQALIFSVCVYMCRVSQRLSFVLSVYLQPCAPTHKQMVEYGILTSFLAKFLDLVSTSLIKRNFSIKSGMYSKLGI